MYQDIAHFTLEQLKALAFDMIMSIQENQQNLIILKEAILAKSKEQQEKPIDG